MMEKIELVVRVCIPVFACMGLGFYIRQRGIMSEDARLFINKLVYHVALPVLIFVKIAAQDFTQLIDSAVLIPALGATLLGAVLMGGFAFIGPFRPSLRPLISYSAFWGNISYMGFPLAEAAFGEAGLTNAAIMNGFAMPLYVLLGVLALRTCGGKSNGSLSAVGTDVLQALRNPLIIASALGLLVSLIHSHEILAIPVVIIHPINDSMTLIGQMGLPLALLAVGASLKLDTIRGEYGPLMVMTTAKLAIGPALCYGISLIWFPDAARAATGTAVLLMAMPAAVAGYVITSSLSEEGDISASCLALSTVISFLTIPLWLFILL